MVGDDPNRAPACLEEAGDAADQAIQLAVDLAGERDRAVMVAVLVDFARLQPAAGTRVQGDLQSAGVDDLIARRTPWLRGVPLRGPCGRNPSSSGWNVAPSRSPATSPATGVTAGLAVAVTVGIAAQRSLDRRPWIRSPPGVRPTGGPVS